MHPLVLFASLVGLCGGCTVLMAAKGATVDGSLMTSHTNDGDGTTDGRLFRVPAQNYAQGTMRPVYPSPESYPRLVLSDGSRGKGNYYPLPGQTDTIPLGYIPQVNHTYTLFEALYGIMNEHGLSMGESTCSCISWSELGYQPPETPTAMMSIDELSRIALERCITARCAVQTMGTLAQQYGFYGPDSFEGTGESMMIIDTNEAFVFHILTDPTYKSAIWAAQRVPDDHVVVVANMFIIREVNASDSFNFMYSDNMFKIAEDNHLWTPDTPFDFTKVYSDGEYAHKYYSGRRMWGAARLFAPSLNLSAEYGNLLLDAPYPFSYRPDKKVTAQDFIRVLRDWYADTPYDMTQGLAAGPFGTPNRYAAGAGEQAVNGSWERSITLYRTTYSWVVQVSADMPTPLRAVMWFGPHAAHGTCYIPIPVGSRVVPESYRIGHQAVLDRASAFWTFRYLENLANLKFQYFIKGIQAMQTTLEKQGEMLIQQWKQMPNQPHIRGLSNAEEEDGGMTKSMVLHAEKVLATWWKLGDALMATYADGYFTYPAGGHDVSTAIGYPAWWLEAVGYEEGPTPIV